VTIQEYEIYEKIMIYLGSNVRKLHFYQKIHSK